MRAVQHGLGGLKPYSNQPRVSAMQHGLGGPGAMRGVAGMAGRGKAGRDDGALTGGRLSRRASDPAAEAERRAAQDKMFALDLDRVRNSARPAKLGAQGICQGSQPATQGQGWGSQFGGIGGAQWLRCAGARAAQDMRLFALDLHAYAAARPLLRLGDALGQG